MRYWRVLSALLSIAATAAAQTTAPARPKTLRLPAGADRVVIPLETAGALLVAKVSVNGKEPGRFIVDTGAITCVDWAFADRLKLQELAAGQAKNAVVPERIFQVGRLSLGQAEFRPTAIAGVDLRQLSSFAGFQVDGLIGSDLLGLAPFEIDYRRHTLTVFNPGGFSPPPNAPEVPLRIDKGDPAIELVIEGYRIEALIDTGEAGRSSLSVVPLVDHPNLLVGKPRWESPTVDMKGIHRDFLCRFDPVSFLGRKPRAVWFSCSVDYDANDNIQTRGNTIGGDELKDGRFTFDFAHKRMWAKWPPPEAAKVMLKRLGDPRGHDLSGITPLMIAAQEDRDDVAAALLQGGADVNARDSIGRTPLMFAATYGSAKVTALLLAHDVLTDPEIKPDGQTALHLACRQFNLDVVKMLLKAGADPNARDDQGRTPLTRAAEGGQGAIVAALVAGGADPLAAADKDGNMPLDVAAKNARPTVLAPMLDKLKGTANFAQTETRALLWASASGNPQTVKWLLKYGCDPDGVGPAGVTPLMDSVYDDTGEVAMILLDHGANPDRRSNEGLTAWDWALMRRNIPVIRVLQNLPAPASPHK